MALEESAIIGERSEAFKRSRPRRLRIGAFLAGDFPEGAASTGRIKCYASGLKEQGHGAALLLFWQGPFSDGAVNTEMIGTWEGVPFRFLNRSNRRPTTLPAKFGDTLVAAYNSSRYLIQNRRLFDVLYL